MTRRCTCYAAYLEPDKISKRDVICRRLLCFSPGLKHSTPRVKIASRSRLEVDKQHIMRVSLTLLFFTPYYCQLAYLHLCSLAFSQISSRLFL